MTKPQESSEANWKVTKGKKSTYTTFYLILLVLLTISTGVGLLGLGSIDQSFEMIQTQPAIAYLTLAQHVVTIIMTVALIFLYKKQKRGLMLAFTGYGVALLIAILLLFFRDAAVQDIIQQIPTDEGTGVTPELAKQAITTVLTIAPIINIVMCGLFGTLWYFAWKKQMLYDSTGVKK